MAAEGGRLAGERSPARPYIDASENDTDGRCVCEKCLLDEPDPAWEVPFDRRVAVAREKMAKKDPHWTSALGSLSDRYARYYLAVQHEAEKHDPQAVVMGYSYANYVKPPRNTKLNRRIIIGIVLALMYPWTQTKRDAFGAVGRLGGRGGPAFPAAELHARRARPADLLCAKAGRGFLVCRAHGLIGTDFDSLTGQWASQGPNLYVLARLHDARG